MTVVRLAVDLVLQAGASLRGAAAGLSLIAARLDLDVAMPSYSAVRSWLLRLGCHALTCPLPGGVWVWLIDHTVQIGAGKLLVIVGCLGNEAALGERPLRQSDLHLIGLALMEHATQETVAVELERAAKRTGAPRQIVSDQGSDLNGGVKQFQQQHQTDDQLDALLRDPGGLDRLAVALGQCDPNAWRYQRAANENDPPDEGLWRWLLRYCRRSRTATTPP